MILLNIILAYEVLSIFGGIIILVVLKILYQKKNPNWYSKVSQKVAWYTAVECHLVTFLFIIVWNLLYGG